MFYYMTTIRTSEELFTFLTRSNEILSNTTINILSTIDMKKFKEINNKSFILNNVTFNGNNRSIINLNLLNPLFKSVDKKSTIKYVYLNKVNNGNGFVLKNEGLIMECSLDTIYADNKDINSLMVSENYGTIKNSTIVNSYIVYTKPNTIVMGLLCGTNFNIIDNCSSKRNTINNEQFVAGGLVGINKGTITKCYVELLNNNSLYTGSLVGDVDSNSNINCCQINNLTLNDNGNNNGIIFSRVINNNFKISCININPKVFNKYIDTDIMNKYKDNIQNIMIKSKYNDLFTINNSLECVSNMKIRPDTFMNVKNDSNWVYLMILFLLICIIIYLLKFYKK